MNKINRLFRDPKEPGGENDVAQDAPDTATQEGGEENGGDGDAGGEGGE